MATQPDAEAAGNPSDLDVDYQLRIESAGGDSLPDVPLPDVPLPDVPLPDVSLHVVPLPDVPLHDISFPDVPLPDIPLAEAHSDGSVGDQ